MGFALDDGGHGGHRLVDSIADSRPVGNPAAARPVAILAHRGRLVDCRPDNPAIRAIRDCPGLSGQFGETWISGQTRIAGLTYPGYYFWNAGVSQSPDAVSSLGAWDVSSTRLFAREPRHSWSCHLDASLVIIHNCRTHHCSCSNRHSYSGQKVQQYHPEIVRTGNG